MTSESKFYMWRAIIVMAHADGVLHQSEADYLKTLFAKMHELNDITEAQYKTLVDDLATPGDIDVITSQIKDPAFQAQLTYFARLLAFKDGQLHPSEEMLLKKFEAFQKPVSGELKDQVRRNVQQDILIHETNKDVSTRPDKDTPLSYLIDKLALFTGRDLIDE